MRLSLLLLGALPPALLLFTTPLAHGYDGWYYVLQVRSMLVGEPLFTDGSLVFVLLVGLTRLSGSAILAGKLAACLFGGLTALGGMLAGWRWTGSRAGGVACGVWWALSPLHLGVTAEYLKNAGGVAVLALLIAALAGTSRRSLIAAVGLALLGPLVHKLTGVLGLLLLIGRLIGGRLPPRILLAAVGLGVVAVLSVGLLRPEDLARLLGGTEGAPRWMLAQTGRLMWAEKLELVAVHLAPVLLAAGLWRRADLRPLGLPMLAVSLIVLAPGLPLGFDLTAWRLLLMGFLPVGMVAAMVCTRRPMVAGGVLLAGLLTLPATLPAQRSRSPDYPALAAMLPIIQAQVPADDRLVAHRGLCGFLWAEGGRVCENFQPVEADLSGWWRVAYGFSAARLGPSAIPLTPGYALLPEPDWQAFVAGDGARFSLTRDARNPHEPRPGFVYAPGE
ncbi:MAG: hypothetical protein ACI8RZ_006192 [Myxococcota bacterium]